MAINTQAFDEAATVKFSPGKPGGLGTLSSRVDPKISGETRQLQTTARVMTTTSGGKESQGREMERGEVHSPEALVLPGPRGPALPSADTQKVARMSRA